MKTKKEIEQLAKKQKGCSKEYCDSIDEQYGYLNGYIEGYTQCQEDMADKKYTEDDIYMALEFGRSHSSMTDKQFIESLNKQD